MNSNQAQLIRQQLMFSEFRELGINHDSPNISERNNITNSLPTPYQYEYENNNNCPQNVYTPHVYEWNKPQFPNFLNPEQSIDLKLVRKPHKTDGRCYTCKPRGKVKKHIINTNETGKFYFHHDMHKRPIIIMTPSRHVETIDELTTDELLDLFKSLKKFTSFWSINEYQLSYNTGNWKNHEHFHCKIRISEKIINRMRRDHFQLLKLNSNYKSGESDEE
jgi:hypothetical protein